MTFDAPTVDYAGLSPIIALTTGLVLIVLVAVFDSIKRSLPGWPCSPWRPPPGC